MHQRILVVFLFAIAVLGSCARSAASDKGDSAPVVENAAERVADADRTAAAGERSPEPTAEEATAEPSEAPAAANDPESEESQTEGPTFVRVSYRADVRPIFAAKCIACHHDNNAVEVILTDPFDPELGIINRPNTWKQSSRPILVVPSAPEESALMLKVEETELELKIDGDPMPWSIPYATDPELAGLAEWINDGAEDNEQFRRLARPLFGDGVSLGRRGGRCTYCHHPWEGRYEPDLVNVFDPNAGAVKVASFYGGLRIASGDASASVVYLRTDADAVPPRLQPPMPQHYERLTEEELSILREWIRQGAQDN